MNNTTTANHLTALKVKKVIKRTIPYIIISIVAIVFVMPLLWMINTSLKSSAEVFSTTSGFFPRVPQWDNYVKVFQRMRIGLYLKNTLITSVLPTIGQLISAPMTAYAISLINWKGKKILFPIILLTMMIPVQVTQVTLFGIWSKLNMVNTFTPLILPAFFGGAYNIFLLRQFMMGLPKSLIEAAKIDGASQTRILYQIIYPLCKPVLITIGLMTFMGAWNDLMTPLIYLFDSDKLTLAVALQRFLTDANKQWELLMAASTIFTAPIIVLFFFGQRYFIEGIVTSGLK
ncbi:ABC transporter permease subunit [Schleiferilactobacillus harbinensis]|jgi:multiple sugar transport system permease protein|uniref:Carbohydrate ABC transporter permease n=2 Tax=Schleiferilactobacillus harbinensis TaxID=304207 RepID=A0ABU7SX11_9LACO|nr:carbohydrate ABC transporter permease [Schleiferilactobacillus harbinensis]KRM26900.1 protein LplC [Schleiferilactobacillus harbinensis DSM 16991]MCI1686524.1 carbohydrate ABC transporter permease [Schleiferilactobacillus harbinensis]MCI1782835.1 carbohydrate ABC transporter permease [Schleiferilactobacillus harbinensis]MCI1850790.1 carbohydrate ABC transporter permease [Schleiferilactobacillus harbinensis]QFR63292.1 ABC transporter permease subunit [Schleiferilactobacillus harbinensis]